MIWFHWLSISFLALGGLCAFWIAYDEWRHPQHMWIMNIVWPVTALFGTVFSVWGYYRFGRLATQEQARTAQREKRELPNKRLTPFPVKVAKGTIHCGAGCTLGDVLAEWLVVFVPVIAVWLGWQGIFSEKMFAVWVLDYVFAFIFGIAFQYFTIVPMRQLSPGEGLRSAIKADILSLTAWQVGMYGFMAFVHFYLFAHVFHQPLEVASPEFWFMMQIAMIAGFVTSYPVNWWLIRRGIKEAM